MASYILGVALAIAAFALGVLTGTLRIKSRPNGYIHLEKNEEGYDRIRFDLKMDFEEIAQHKHIFLIVKKGL